MNFSDDSDPRAMKPFFFWGHLRLNCDSAIRADTSKQDFTIFPRDWYIDATFRCTRCHEEFDFTAAEQRVWYEDYRFYVDTVPRQCIGCRRELRKLKHLRQEYNRGIADALASKDIGLKVHMASIIDQLDKAGAALPKKIHANRELLAKQITRRASQGDA